MTEKEAMEALLHVVWKQFDYYASNAIPHLEELVAYYKSSETHRLRYGNQLDGCKSSLTMLRAVLLERCDNHKFNHMEPDMGTNPAAHVLWHKEMAAFHSFWAWELGQREREQTS